MTIKDKECVGRADCKDISCSECFVMGDSVPDWPRRVECKKLDKRLISVLEDEGGLVTEEEATYNPPLPTPS